MSAFVPLKQLSNKTISDNIGLISPLWSSGWCDIRQHSCDI